MLMKRRIAWTLLALVIAAGCASEPAAPSLSPEEKDALRFVRDWCAAYQKHDADALDRILADDFVLTGTTGKLSGKADALKSARLRDVVYSALESRDMQVRLHGDTAVVTGRTRIEGVRGGSTRFASEFRFTDIIVRDGDSWKAVAAHLTRLAP